MNKKPNFSNLALLFKSRSNFSLTETQYEQLTGANLPQNTRYIEQKSALSRLANSNGFTVTVKERIVLCEKKN